MRHTLKALILQSESEFLLLEVDSPTARIGQAIVDVEIAGIGGGEDLGHKMPGVRPLPNIMEHGFAGYVDGRRFVVDPARNSGEQMYFRPGHPSFCDDWRLIGLQSNVGFAEKAVAALDALVQLPDSLSWEQAAFIEPFAKSINAWSLGKADKRSSVAVIGVGASGLGLIACAGINDCTDISASDPSGHRLRLAKEFGAEELDPGRTYDLVFDTIGTVETRELAIGLTAKLGTCIWTGFAPPSDEVANDQFIGGDKTVASASAYSREEFAAAIELAHHARSEWVTNVSFANAESYLKAIMANDVTTVRAALRPDISGTARSHIG